MNRTRTFRRSRRFRRQKREYIWVCVNVLRDLQNLNGVADAFPIVVRDDWARDPTRSTTLEKGAVLLRVTGDIRVSTDNNAGTYAPAGSNFVWAIGKFDEDDTHALDLATDFFNEDWLQLRAGTCWPTASSASLSPVPFALFPGVDIRVKRKLTTEDEIRLVFAGYEYDGTSSTTNKLAMNYEFRSLIQLP